VAQLATVGRKEEVFQEQFDAVMKDKLKVDKKSYAWFSVIMTALFTISTCLVSFYKADFINLTIAALAIFLLTNADQAKKNYFRLLTISTAGSLVLDLMWFMLRNRGGKGNQEVEGLEGSIMMFSMTMAYISFVLKIVMIIVFWRTSISFEDVID